MNNNHQSSASVSGTRDRSASPWLTTGSATDSATNVAVMPTASRRGGNTAARLMRWMWNQSPNTSSSGTPR